MHSPCCYGNTNNVKKVSICFTDAIFSCQVERNMTYALMRTYGVNVEKIGITVRSLLKGLIPRVWLNTNDFIQFPIKSTSFGKRVEVKSVLLIAKVSKLLWKFHARAIHFSKTQFQSSLEKVSNALTRD